MSNKNILKILILCTVFAFSVGIASSAGAPPNLPMGLYGNVNIGSSPASVDTIIDGRVGNQIVASTKVVNAGKYGDNSNYLGIYAATEGTNVDIYVNDVKVATVAYISGKSTKVDLNAPATSGTTGPSVGSVNGGSGGGGGSGAVGTPKATAAIQQPVKTKESISGTQSTGTPVGTPVSTPGGTQFYTILGVFVLLASAVIIIFALKKMGKI